MWTTVQIANLAVEAVTPLTVAVLGVLVARAGRRIEQIQWANQMVVTRRLDVFSQLAPGLNQLLCFAIFIGMWKEIQPRQAIATKRTLDQTMYTNKILFSEELFDAYHKFMETLFAMYATADQDAQLRAPIQSIWGDRRNMPWWEDSMASLFSEHHVSELNDIEISYDQLAEQFRTELYVTQPARPIFNAQALRRRPAND